MRVFVDTNVLLYALDSGDPIKQRAAQLWRAHLWKSRSGRLSFQVLQEFYVQAVRKNPRRAEAARAEVRDLLAWAPRGVDAELLESAWGLQGRFSLSFWDAMIVAAARAERCGHLLTEDLAEGQDYDGVVVVNPFHTLPAELDTGG